MPPAHTQTPPKVSVIIPSYKTADLIAACLQSAFAQTYSDFEAIVVNDGSPDTSELERVLHPYLDRIIYIQQKNKGAAAARNNAIQHSQGDFIVFLDSDDTWMPDHLASQMQLFKEDPSLDLVYCDSILVLDAATECRFMEKHPSNGEASFGALIVERCQIPISTVVARKSALLKAGLFDETLPRCDDYDMWIRTAFSGARIGYSRKIGARLHVGRPGSLSESKARMAEGSWTVLEKVKRTLPLTGSDRAMVERRSAEIKARYLLEEGKCKIDARQFAEARLLIAEANLHFHKSLLSLAVCGLAVVPGLTARLMHLRRKIRSVASNRRLARR